MLTPKNSWQCQQSLCIFSKRPILAYFSIYPLFFCKNLNSDFSACLSTSSQNTYPTFARNLSVEDASTPQSIFQCLSLKYWLVVCPFILCNSFVTILKLFIIIWLIMPCNLFTFITVWNILLFLVFLFYCVFYLEQLHLFLEPFICQYTSVNFNLYLLFWATHDAFYFKTVRAWICLSVTTCTWFCQQEKHWYF